MEFSSAICQIEVWVQANFNVWNISCSFNKLLSVCFSENLVPDLSSSLHFKFIKSLKTQPLQNSFPPSTQCSLTPVI